MLLQGTTLEELQMQKQHVQDLLNQNIRQAVQCVGCMSDPFEHCRCKPCCCLRPQPVKCTGMAPPYAAASSRCISQAHTAFLQRLPTEVDAACLPKHLVKHTVTV